MSAVPTPIRATPEGDRLGSLTHVAEALGVRPQQVDAWIKRRRINGCPEPVPGHRHATYGHAETDWFDIDEWRVWQLTYEPQHGVPMRARSADPSRGGPAVIGRLLTTRSGATVTTKQVCKWIDRRHANGCPEKGEDGFYDLAAWVTWHERYSARVASAA